MLIDPIAFILIRWGRLIIQVLALNTLGCAQENLVERAILNALFEDLNSRFWQASSKNETKLLNPLKLASMCFIMVRK